MAKGPATVASSRRKSTDLEAGEERTVIPARAGDLLAGRYRLDKKIGEGGMGSVYVAHDLELDRAVAVKMLASALVNDPELVERFEREARLMAKLDHPNLVPIYDVGRHEGRPYIVMKLLEGHSLVDVLRDRGGFKGAQLVNLMRQLAAGLDHIHARGFIHRDIKSGNIFLSETGHATILDFGILRSRISNQPITRMGMVMGTPHYMAPEQALGLKVVDHRVDLYALAVVLFELLSGTLPFEGDSEIALIQMQAHSPPPDLLSRAPWVPPAVAQMMQKALAKVPDQRFNSGAELVTALEEAMAQPGVARPAVAAVAATAVSVPELKAVTPRKMRRALVGFSVLAVVAGLVWAFALKGPSITTPVQVQVDAGALVAMVPPVVPVEASIDASVALIDAGEPLAVDVDAGEEPLAVAVLPDAGAEEAPVDAGKALKVAPAVPGKKRGRLLVVSLHSGEAMWAQVSIDGVPMKRTPYTSDWLAVGPHSVTVERSGFRTQQRWVNVVAGKTTPVKFDLRP